MSETLVQPGYKTKPAQLQSAGLGASTREFASRASGQFVRHGAPEAVPAAGSQPQQNDAPRTSEVDYVSDFAHVPAYSAGKARSA
jgi:hypothetical protein